MSAIAQNHKDIKRLDLMHTEAVSIRHFHAIMLAWKQIIDHLPKNCPAAQPDFL